MLIFGGPPFTFFGFDTWVVLVLWSVLQTLIQSQAIRWTKPNRHCISGPDPGFSVGGRGPILGGFGLQRGHFSVKMYVKMKELGPVGGRAPARPLDPPMYLMGHH